MSARAGIQEASIEAVVVRCGCGDPAGIHPHAPCPSPAATEDLGTVSYYHRNPLKRWLRNRKAGR